MTALQEIVTSEITKRQPRRKGRGRFQRDMAEVSFGHAESFYEEWPSPICIVCDGPYGISGYPGDLSKTDKLAEWYVPHVRAWSESATPQTTLWFWNTEIGWATVHPTLQAFGWEYRACHVWDKGLGHVAGNANTKTLRKLPVTTEVCVQYVKPSRLNGMSMQDWLRHEWRRTGLPFRLANDACGVADAATRKYLTADHLWYFPPPDAFKALSDYANSYGNPSGRPYFSGNGVRPFTVSEWSRQRAKFKCPVGVTNVWRRPHVGGSERVNGRRQDMRWKFKSLHGSQKPLELIDTTIKVCTDPGDVVWEPFGGLCPALVSSWRSDRVCRSAEIVPEFYDAAVERLANA